MIESFVSLK